MWTSKTRRGPRDLTFVPTGSSQAPTSALGHKRTLSSVRVMSVIPLKADIHQRTLHVRYVPIADMWRDLSN
jgi:hypothetical protein